MVIVPLTVLDIKHANVFACFTVMLVVDALNIALILSLLYLLSYSVLVLLYVLLLI